MLETAPWLLLALWMLLVTKCLSGCVLLHVRLLAHGRTTIEHLFSRPLDDDKDVDRAAVKAWLEEVFGRAMPRSLGGWARLGPAAAAWVLLVRLYARSPRARRLVRFGSN